MCIFNPIFFLNNTYNPESWCLLNHESWNSFHISTCSSASHWLSVYTAIQLHGCPVLTSAVSSGRYFSDFVALILMAKWGSCKTAVWSMIPVWEGELWQLQTGWMWVSQLGMSAFRSFWDSREVWRSWLWRILDAPTASSSQKIQQC